MTNPKHQTQLPQLNGTKMLTDGGLETTLIFHNGIDLPHFAAFDLLQNVKTRDALKTYYRTYASIAKTIGSGFIFDAPTWRASADWGDKLGYNPTTLDAVNCNAIQLMTTLAAEFASTVTPIVISGCIGPRGDGYNPAIRMNVDEAQDYHTAQTRSFVAAGADMISVFTMNYVEEAIGITLAAKAAEIPAAISFTLETDGCLATGQSLGDAIIQVDKETNSAPAYFMINCAHPTHFSETLPASAPWLDRIMGIRANASCMSHAELDNAETLDDGDPARFGEEHRNLLNLLPNLMVFGGCCGTDHRHIEAIGQACLHPAP